MSTPESVTDPATLINEAVRAVNLHTTPAYVSECIEKLTALENVLEGKIEADVAQLTNSLNAKLNRLRKGDVDFETEDLHFYTVKFALAQEINFRCWISDHHGTITRISFPNHNIPARPKIAVICIPNRFSDAFLAEAEKSQWRTTMMKGDKLHAA